MKKVLVILLMLLSYTTIAQNYETVVKFLPFNLKYNSPSFEIERLDCRNSLLVTVVLPYNSSISGRSFGKLYIDPKQYSNINLHTYSTRVAYRHYTQLNKVFGLYYEGYFKCQTLDWSGDVRNKNINMGNINGYLFTTNAGIQIGYQFLIKKKLVVDFYAIGLELGTINGGNNSKSTDLDKAKYMLEYTNRMTKYIPTRVVEISTNINDVDMDIRSFSYPYFRSGISIGYRF